MPSTLDLTQDLLDYIQQSPTPFHATENLRTLFAKNNFTPLSLHEPWQLALNTNYVVHHEDGAIIAFRTATKKQTSLRIIGAHTDSPCLKIKPVADITKSGYWQLGVEVYGGVLLHPWLDRDLSIAGRVSGVDKNDTLMHSLIDFKKPVGVIPNLAIHLDRNANQEKPINPQQHCSVIMGLDQKDSQHLQGALQQQCPQEMARILAFELSFYDTQAPSIVGLNDDFICSARLDNLLSTYVCARALLDNKPSVNTQFFVANNHEEVGSNSTSGAQGPFLSSVLQRLSAFYEQDLAQLVAQSILLSCDNAHGIHPNYAEKHDANHGPLLNHGPVIKINQNQRYATNSRGNAFFKQLCEREKIPVQEFVIRSDMGCGSTIGPITATLLGIETIDIGAPQWAMHSIRETAGTADCAYLYRALSAFLQ